MELRGGGGSGWSTVGFHVDNRLEDWNYAQTSLADPSDKLEHTKLATWWGLTAI
jgi:hypothetical protein